jgi:hypothetical protein
MQADLENDLFFLKLVEEGAINVSADGDVFNNITNKEIGFVTGGYKRISMFGKSCAVNRLVYMVFVGEIPEGFLVNHKDGNKLNNSYENFDLRTNSQNMQHAVDSLGYVFGLHLNYVDNTGSKNGMAKLDDISVEFYRKAIDRGDMNVKDVVKHTQMLRKAVMKMLKGETYKDVQYVMKTRL